MAGSVLFGVLTIIVVLLLLTGIASPIWLVPLIVIGLGLLMLTPLLAKLRGSVAAAERVEHLTDDVGVTAHASLGRPGRSRGHGTGLAQRSGPVGGLAGGRDPHDDEEDGTGHPHDVPG